MTEKKKKGEKILPDDCIFYAQVVTDAILDTCLLAMEEVSAEEESAMAQLVPDLEEVPVVCEVPVLVEEVPVAHFDLFPEMELELDDVPLYPGGPMGRPAPLEEDQYQEVREEVFQRHILLDERPADPPENVQEPPVNVQEPPLNVQEPPGRVIHMPPPPAPHDVSLGAVETPRSKGLKRIIVQPGDEDVSDEVLREYKKANRNKNTRLKTEQVR